MARVPPDDFAFLPGHGQEFGGDPCGVDDRMRTEIADALMDVELAIRLDDQESVETDRTCHERAERRRDPGYFGAAGAVWPLLPSLPLEQLAALIERFARERAGDGGPWTIRCLAESEW